jgi:hypothetical protein
VYVRDILYTHYVRHAYVYNQKLFSRLFTPITFRPRGMCVQCSSRGLNYTSARRLTALTNTRKEIICFSSNASIKAVVQSLSSPVIDTFSMTIQHFDSAFSGGLYTFSTYCGSRWIFVLLVYSSPPRKQYTFER